MAKDQLRFDTTDAGTITDSDKTLAGILSTDGSTLITDTLEGGKQGLDVYVINTSVSTTANHAYAEDSAHTTGDFGSFSLAVRNDTEGSLVSADGDYAPLQVDSLGRLRVTSDISVTNGHEKEEDTAHSSGDTGSYMLTVRADARPTDANTSADGDYASIFVNNSGEVYVKDTDAAALLTTIDADTSAINTATATIASAYFDEDSGHTSGDKGMQVLAVRNDAGTVLAGSDLDYIPFTTDSSGALRVTSTGLTTINAEKAEDSAHSSGDTGNYVLAVRQDVLAASTDADGDYMSFKGNSKGEIYTIDTDGNALLTTIDADTSAINTNIADITKEEDAAHTSGDKGVMSLAVRQDTLSSSTSADGDYASLKVNADGRLYVTVDDDTDSDAALANTAIANTNTVVGTIATDLVGTDLANRKYAMIANLGNKQIYIGGAGVTVASGFPISPGSIMELRAGASIDLHAIKAAGGSANDTRILELS